jgi:hypothetical protein
MLLATEYGTDYGRLPSEEDLGRQVLCEHPPSDLQQKRTINET